MEFVQHALHNGSPRSFASGLWYSQSLDWKWVEKRKVRFYLLFMEYFDVSNVTFSKRMGMILKEWKGATNYDYESYFPVWWYGLFYYCCGNGKLKNTDLL